MKKKLIRIAKFTGILMLFLLLGAYFVGASLLQQQGQPQLLCKRLDIHIADSSHNRLVLQEDVYDFFQKHYPSLLGDKITELNTHQIENRLQEMVGIQSCEIYHDIQGSLTANITLRQPLLRLLSEEGSYYLDDAGALFPSLPRRTAYVPVVSGNIPLTEASWIAQLYEFGQYIHNHRFWDAQIEQLYVHNPQHIELIPRAGQQTIILGDLHRFQYKLQKLYSFYRNVAPAEGWDSYASVDLRFGDQIVCTRNTAKK
jgi:hypothetical protein